MYLNRRAAAQLNRHFCPINFIAGARYIQCNRHIRVDVICGCPRPTQADFLLHGKRKIDRVRCLFIQLSHGFDGDHTADAIIHRLADEPMPALIHCAPESRRASLRHCLHTIAVININEEVV